MRKNKTMRAAASLLALTLITSSFVGGTFAKYVTSGDGTDTARVAKFGVEVTGEGTMFAKAYATDDAAFTEINSVISTEKVVAPGTDGGMSAIGITGTPEVAVSVDYTATVDIGEGWVDKDGNYYCPLEITVGTTTIKGLEQQSAEAFEAAVKSAIDEHSEDYPAGTDLSAATVAVPSVSWAWPFSTGTDNDVKDTYLGDQAAANNAATVSVKVKTTVTQID